VVTKEISLDVNALPVGVVNAEQEAGINNFAVKFETKGSKDPDGTIQTYRWDLDLDKDSNGDGDPANDIDSTDANPSFDYGQAGTYSYKLVLTDNKGATTEVVDDVTVSAMSTMTVGLIGGISLLILLAAISALLVMRRRKRRPPSTTASKLAEIPPSSEGSGTSLTNMDDVGLYSGSGPGYGEVTSSRSYAPVDNDYLQK
jgi:PKD repeat protein